MEGVLIFYLLPTVVLPFHLSMIGGQKNSGTEEAGINVPGLTALFANKVKRKGLEEETIECYCEGYVDGRYHTQGNCLEQLFCEHDSFVRCKKSGGCMKNIFTVQGKEFVVKFCGDAKNSQEEHKCKVRRANSTAYGKVELLECLCHGDHCNGAQQSQFLSSSLSSHIIFLSLLIIGNFLQRPHPG